jgi:hypothetical protein
MNFNLKHALVATMVATVSMGAVIERKATQNNLPVVQLEETNADELNLLLASRFKFCRNINFDDCITFDGISSNICCKYILLSTGESTSNNAYLTFSDNLPTNWNNVCSSAQALDGNRCIIYR